MERREFLAALAALGGGVLSSSTLQALEKLGPFPVGEPVSWQKRPLLKALVGAILPRTDTPGAADVGVVDFVLQFAQQLMEPDDREDFLQGLDAFDAAHPGFNEASAASRESVLRGLLNEDVEADPMARSIVKVRELTIVGYYNSEVGASCELVYDPVPGPFRQVTIAEYGRTWAT